MPSATITENSENSTSERLFREFGELLTLADASKVLGYPSYAAFRKAVYRGQVPLRVIQIEQRRGRFIKTADLNEYLQSL